MAILAEVGIKLKPKSIKFLFGEDQARYLVSGLKKNEDRVKKLANKASIPLINVGKVIGDDFCIGEKAIQLIKMKNLFEKGLDPLFV